MQETVPVPVLRGKLLFPRVGTKLLGVRRLFVCLSDADSIWQNLVGSDLLTNGTIRL